MEARIEERELARTADRLSEFLAPLLESLPAEERLLLRLSFFKGLSMATIAPILGRLQKELYKVRERCLGQIQRSLGEAGMSPEQVRELIGRLQGSLGLERSLSGSRVGDVSPPRTLHDRSEPGVVLEGSEDEVIAKFFPWISLSKGPMGISIRLFLVACDGMDLRHTEGKVALIGLEVPERLVDTPGLGGPGARLPWPARLRPVDSQD